MVKKDKHLQRIEVNKHVKVSRVISEYLKKYY